MCDTNAWGDSSCAHYYDRVDRAIMVVILYAFLNGEVALTRKELFRRIRPLLNSNEYLRLCGQALSNRLQLLAREGYITNRGHCLSWDPTQKLRSAYVRWQAKSMAHPCSAAFAKCRAA